MFTRFSSEFVSLCRNQVALLTQGLGAASGAVYLTEEFVEGNQAKLIPVVVYPETSTVWDMSDPDWVLPQKIGEIDQIPRLSSSLPRLLPQGNNQEQDVDSTYFDWTENSLQQQHQIVLPLIHEGIVMGLLVSARDDRPWNHTEQASVESIARTLAIAYVIEQRQGWFEQQLTQHRRLQAKQRDMLDDLLHQFRNPLMALRTFGKLLLKRLVPGDKNYPVASSIIRESDRLQELLQQFNACLDMNQTDTASLTLPVDTAEASSSPESDDLGEIYPTSHSEPHSTPGEFPLLTDKTLPLELFAVKDVLEPLLISADAITQEANLELYCSIAPNLPLVKGNPKALREVLSNLIDNALKYTPAGGKIDIQVGVGQWLSHGDAIAIAISDTGPGIAPEDLDHLFERHYRGVQANGPIPGTGLGLAIAKELMEYMQGDIEVLSPAKLLSTEENGELSISHGQDNSSMGTTFIVWLTYAQ
ncbi:MAG: sensor histidine kinase [Moorea sp. SIOASIH]|uniref:GAF domain-containing sensor histidine kinase n=1 Tax=Moorena sp. SIOASIH TaxID=2607817 RepID=UPI0013BB4A30|nr:GAF domain-containing sensor histidine kinase [Moorena sp. SIOASIH]NEO41945.1 sensor histidine kinase [Moorena sp. SIOASIH]NEO89265.1 sensor histidine kinase [Moorena sp. SIO3G5]